MVLVRFCSASDTLSELRSQAARVRARFHSKCGQDMLAAGIGRPGPIRRKRTLRIAGEPHTHELAAYAVRPAWPDRPRQMVDCFHHSRDRLACRLEIDRLVRP